MKLKSLYSRIALTFAVLILLFGGLCGALDFFAAKRHQQEIVQRLSQDLAKHIADHWPLVKANNLDTAAIGELFHMLMVVNPSIEVYLLDKDGVIKAHQAPPGRVQLTQVRLEPIRAFLAHQPLPLSGDNPRIPEQPSVFSATALQQDGIPVGFLYIILTGDAYQQQADQVWQGHVFQSAIWVGMGALLLTLLVGLGVFAAITRRLDALTCTVAAFEEADFVGGLHVCPKITASGDEIGVLSRTFERMAERIGNQMQLIKHQDELRREMIADVSHDLRTPLTSLQGYLETVLRKADDLPLAERQRYLSVAVRQSRRVNLLAGELFELAKLECEATSPNCETFFIQELAQDVLQKFQLAAETKAVNISVVWPEELTPVFADIAMIERVLTNLLDNALRHTPANGSITVTVKPGPDTVSLRIADTGEGISPQQLAGLFDRHSPLRQNASKKHGGGGLGLLICKRIVQLHGSGITADSQLGRGTAFSFSLPTRMPD
ncbi:HAMP domain-containing sensor histidine kinase [Methylovulum miyakonense]|uniref:HAMP domain-containing sensor histidine kinase n=1 Tax=Methylovulum miyakonense TaxID=645578 RepID=UPI0003750931|nr:HAMP domain-containing sensor histidine kinase [Methylovulum miyakonense]